MNIPDRVLTNLEYQVLRPSHILTDYRNHKQLPFHTRSPYSVLAYCTKCNKQQSFAIITVEPHHISAYVYSVNVISTHSFEEIVRKNGNPQSCHHAKLPPCIWIFKRSPIKMRRLLPHSPPKLGILNG